MSTDFKDKSRKKQMWEAREKLILRGGGDDQWVSQQLERDFPDVKGGKDVFSVRQCRYKLNKDPQRLAAGKLPIYAEREPRDKSKRPTYYLRPGDRSNSNLNWIKTVSRQIGDVPSHDVESTRTVGDEKEDKKRHKREIEAKRREKKRLQRSRALFRPNAG